MRSLWALIASAYAVVGGASLAVCGLYFYGLAGAVAALLFSTVNAVAVGVLTADAERWRTYARRGFITGER